MTISLFSAAWRRIVLLLVLSMAVAGCAGPKVANDLLANVKVADKPVSSSAYDLTVTINPHISNYEGIDQSVQESLNTALAGAKIFSADGTSRYKIAADVTTASQAAMSFGSFDGKLEIRYTVADPSGHQVINTSIYTEAGSDHWYFSGAERSRRARAVNIAKNVLEFVDYLRTSGKVN